jgi:RND family efflux transporter MFP subunit
MKNMKKKFLQYPTALTLVAIVILVTLVLATRYGLLPFTRWAKHIVPGTPVSVTAEPISIINKPVPIVRTGSIENSTVLPITTDFSGRISEVYITEGQVVKAGQPLLKLLGASGPSTNNGTAVNQIGGANQQVQESYDNALKEYNRLQKLYDQGAIPRRQVDEAATRLQAAQESLANSQGTAAQPTRNTTTATSSDGFTTISAPVGGTVTKLSTGIDQIVQAGQQLMILGSGEVQVVVPIEQSDLYLVYSGIPATIEVAGQTLTGKVASIYPEIGSDNLPTFRTHIKVTNNTDGLLKIGMAVTVRINTGKSASVLVIPRVAVQEEQGLQYIYLVENGKAVRQQVSIGETIEDFIEITSDLPEQAIVVTSNTDNIRNGDALTVLP